MSEAATVEAAAPFRFDEAAHIYYLGDRVLPGITGILKDCGYIDTTYYTEQARTRGTHVHRAIQYLNKGTLDWDSLADEYMGYVMAYEKFRADWNLKLDLFEEPLHHPDLLFGGTPDMVGTVLDGIPAIVEMKTGDVPRWAALQTAGQELLVQAKIPREPGFRYRRWGLKLNKDGTYKKPVEFKDWWEDEMTFRSLVTAVNRRAAYT